MKVISALFVNAVRVPGKSPEMTNSASSRKGVTLDFAQGLLRVAYTDDKETRAIAVPAANVAYMDLEAEPVAAKVAK